MLDGWNTYVVSKVTLGGCQVFGGIPEPEVSAMLQPQLIVISRVGSGLNRLFPNLSYYLLIEQSITTISFLNSCYNSTHA